MKLNDIYIVAAAVLWGFMGYFNRNLSEFSDIMIIFFRVSVAASMIGILIFAKDKNLFKIKLKDIWCFLGTGVISLFLFNLCYFTNMRYTSLAVCAALLYTAPAFVIILSYFLFKENISFKKMTAIFMTVIGCALVCGIFDGNSDSIPFISILLGLGSGFSYALYSIFSRYALNRGYSSYTITFYTFLFSAFATLLFTDFSIVAANDLQCKFILILGLGIVTAALPYILYTKGLEKSESGRASAICTIEPVVATVLSVAVFSEPLTIAASIGIIIVLAGVILISKL